MLILILIMIFFKLNSNCTVWVFVYLYCVYFNCVYVYVTSTCAATRRHGAPARSMFPHWRFCTTARADCWHRGNPRERPSIKPNFQWRATQRSRPQARLRRSVMSRKRIDADAIFAQRWANHKCRHMRPIAASEPRRCPLSFSRFLGYKTRVHKRLTERFYITISSSFSGALRNVTLHTDTQTGIHAHTHTHTHCDTHTDRYENITPSLGGDNENQRATG